LKKFCRNCGKEYTLTPDKTCSQCGANPVKSQSFCGFCGAGTTPDDFDCPRCGASIKPIPAKVKAQNKENTRRVKFGKRLNIAIVIVLILGYLVLMQPPPVVRAVRDAVNSVTLGTIGYTSMPLQSISSDPTQIPPVHYTGQAVTPDVIRAGATQQLIIYAFYKGPASGNTTRTRLQDVTAKAEYKSEDETIATVTSGGFVTAVGAGTSNIVVSYTAVPGSANLSAALAAGKVAKTFTVIVPVTVN
jgi:hypothetical protein